MHYKEKDVDDGNLFNYFRCNNNKLYLDIYKPEDCIIPIKIKKIFEDPIIHEDH